LQGKEKINKRSKPICFVTPTRPARSQDDMETAVSTIWLLCNLQAKGVLGERARIHTNSQLNCSDE
jgi:hypothetical protein